MRCAPDIYILQWQMWPRLTGDEKLLQAVDTIWDNLVSKKLYVQGGAGAVGDGERYGEDYELAKHYCLQ